MDNFDHWMFKFLEESDESIETSLDDYFLKLKTENPKIYATLFILFRKMKFLMKREIPKIELYTKGFKHQHVFRCTKCKQINQLEADAIEKNFMKEFEQLLEMDEFIDHIKSQKFFANL